jgi:hypothetical protein
MVGPRSPADDGFVRSLAILVCLVRIASADDPPAPATDPAPPATDPWAALSTTPTPPTVPTPQQAAAAAPAPAPEPPPSVHIDARPFDAASMLPKRYELLFNDNWLQPPVGIVYADDRADGIAFVPVHAFGGTIVEHGGGIIGKINNAFLSGAGGYRGTTADGRYEIWDTRQLTNVGPEASWTFNISDEFMGFRADSWWTSWIGWRFGLWSMRQLNTDPGTQQMPGPTADMIARYNALYLYNGGGFEVEFLLRKQVTLAPLGRFIASIDLPVTYLFGGEFFHDDRDMLYTYGGVPRIQGEFQRRLGPIMMHVTASVPTGWLVIPLQRGGQLTVSGGLTF